MYRKSPNGWLKHFDFIFLDIICLHAAFVLAYVIRHGAGNPYMTPLYRAMAFVITFADLVVIFFHQTFKNVLKRGYWQEFSITFKHVLSVELLCVFYLFATQNSVAYSRTVMYLMGVMYFFITYIVRLVKKKILKGKIVKDHASSLLIITTSDIAADVIAHIKEHNYKRFQLSGLVLIDRDGTGETIDGVPVVSDFQNVAEYVCREWIDEVLIYQDRNWSIPKNDISQLAETGVVIHLNPSPIAESLGRKLLVDKIGGYTVLTTSLNYMTTEQVFIKRAFDITAGLIGCILTGIIFIFVAPAIYIQSPGPIFFSQTRVGKNGKKFKLYKFRSMYPDAEERKQELEKNNRHKDGLMFKLEFDPRVIGNKQLPNGRKKTGIGDFLRRTSLDEFPQFWNVLKGDMSLVGTRPPLIEEVEQYQIHHRTRLAAKPGITGMWQISGRSDITDFEEVVKLDTQYINEWSIGLDLRILLKTIAIVLKREGAM